MGAKLGRCSYRVRGGARLGSWGGVATGWGGARLGRCSYRVGGGARLGRCSYRLGRVEV